MGNQHYTPVSNNYGKDVTVAVTHPDGHKERMLVQQGKVRFMATEAGTVTISIDDPEDIDNPDSVGDIIIPSNVGATISMSAPGKPRIVRVKFGSLWGPEPPNN